MHSSGLPATRTQSAEAADTLASTRTSSGGGRKRGVRATTRFHSSLALDASEMNCCLPSHLGCIDVDSRSLPVTSAVAALRHADRPKETYSTTWASAPRTRRRSAPGTDEQKQHTTPHDERVQTQLPTYRYDR